MRTIIPINRTPPSLDLIEYGDYSCPRCRDLQPLLTTILPIFGKDVLYTFRHFPNLSHPQSLLMALAAEAARRQDQYWAMHQALFANRTPLSLDLVSTLAVELGLELKSFLNDIDDKRLKQRILADMKLGRLASVVSTPTLFLGNRRLHGKLTQARLIPLIRHYVDRSNADVLSTIDRENSLVRWSSISYQ